MGKLTDEQRRTLEELQAIADGPDDEDDYEVWVKNDKGAETRIPSRRAGSWLKEQFGISLHDDPAPEGGPEGDPEGDPAPDPKPAGGNGYFSKRKGG